MKNPPSLSFWTRDQGRHFPNCLEGGKRIPFDPVADLNISLFPPPRFPSYLALAHATIENHTRRKGEKDLARLTHLQKIGTGEKSVRGGEKSNFWGVASLE